MRKVAVMGAGKIGSLICYLLVESEAYDVCLIDKDFTGADCSRLDQFESIDRVNLDASDEKALADFLKQRQFDAVLSSLPYFCNATVAKCAKHANCHYFDLTEDVDVTAAVKKLAKGSEKSFVPQCGLAPGFISLVANSLIQRFEKPRSVRMRVGALPVNSNNALQYSLTWSTDGLLNEYANPCHAIRHGKEVILHPLEGIERIQIDGMSYEAFNTSGGVGGLAELYDGKLKTLNYKTIRYPGHCKKMRFLMNDLRLKHERPLLKQVLEKVIPKTYQDVVVVYVSVVGLRSGELIEENYVNKIYPQEISGHRWSAIQVTTAAGICATMDIVLDHEKDYHGFVYQEKIGLEHFLNNRFGRWYQ